MITEQALQLKGNRCAMTLQEGVYVAQSGWPLFHRRAILAAAISSTYDASLNTLFFGGECIGFPRSLVSLQFHYASSPHLSRASPGHIKGV